MTALGGNESAGIGAASDGKTSSTLGRIIIRSGTIIACNTGRNAAGIGESRYAKGGGEIYIYGGNIYATSSVTEPELVAVVLQMPQLKR